MKTFITIFGAIGAIFWLILAYYREIVLGDNAGSERALIMAFLHFLFVQGATK